MSHPEIDVLHPTGEDGKTMHLGLEPGSISPYCLTAGDPERVDWMANTLMRDPVQVGWRRGMTSWTGYTLGTGLRISAITTGMGNPSVGMTMSEAVQCGARRLVAVGSCSTLRQSVRPGSVAIVTGAVRLGGAPDSWAMRGYPAMASFRVTSLLEQAAQELGVNYSTGVEATTDDFWVGQARSIFEDGWLPPPIQDQHGWLIRLNVLLYAMEGSGIFVLGDMLSPLHPEEIWTGRVAAVFGNRVSGEPLKFAGVEEAAKTAIRGLELMADRYPLE